MDIITPNYQIGGKCQVFLEAGCYDAGMDRTQLKHAAVNIGETFMKHNLYYSIISRAAAIITILTLAACSAAPAAPIPTVTSLPISTSTPQSTTVAPPDPNKPNDTTQARLRVSNCIFQGSSVDVFVNGAVAINGDRPMSNLDALAVSGYKYLVPGTYSVAIVPSGKSTKEALLGPLDVTVTAGHRYTLAMLGQVDDARHTPLLVDETAAYQGIGASPTDFTHITINNVKGLTGIDISQGGIIREHDVPYGGFQAGIWPSGDFKGFTITYKSALGNSMDDNGEGDNFPQADNLDCFSGSYPGKIGETFDTHTSAYTSNLNAIEYLRGYSGKNIQVNSTTWSFDTFLAAIKIAGLNDLLTTGSYMLFAPTDAAFATLPKDQLSALMADPKALGDFLQAYIVKGYYPTGSLGQIGHGADRTVTNMLGEQLDLSGSDNLVINGVTMGGGDYIITANGNRLSVITMLMKPAAK
jgi:uncharacterized surface protein with fasciclin (FAS1) repeats